MLCVSRPCTAVHLSTAAYTAVLVLQGGFTRRRDLRRRIAVTLAIFNFSTRFFAQIVENRRVGPYRHGQLESAPRVTVGERWTLKS
jgi:hypothetical protein